MTLSIPTIDIYSAAVAIMLALLMGLAFGAAMVLTLRAEQRQRRRGVCACNQGRLPCECRGSGRG